MTFCEINRSLKHYQDIIAKNDAIINFMALSKLAENLFPKIESAYVYLTDVGKDIDDDLLLKEIQLGWNKRQSDTEINFNNEGPYKELYKYRKGQYDKFKNIAENKEVYDNLNQFLDSLAAADGSSGLLKQAIDNFRSSSGLVNGENPRQNIIKAVETITGLADIINSRKASTFKLIKILDPKFFEKNSIEYISQKIGLDIKETKTLIDIELNADSTAIHSFLKPIRRFGRFMLPLKTIFNWAILPINLLIAETQIKPLLNNTLPDGIMSSEMDDFLDKIGMFKNKAPNLPSETNYNMSSAPFQARYTWTDKVSSYMKRFAPNADINSIRNAFMAGGPNRIEFIHSKQIVQSLSNLVLNQMGVTSIDYFKNKDGTYNLVLAAEFKERFDQLYGKVLQQGGRSPTTGWIKNIGIMLPFTTWYMKVAERAVYNLYNLIVDLSQVGRGKTFKEYRSLVAERLAKDPEFLQLAYGLIYARKMKSRFERLDNGVGESDEDEQDDILSNSSMTVASIEGHPLLGVLRQTIEDYDTKIVGIEDTPLLFAKNLISRAMASFANYTIVPNSFIGAISNQFGFGEEERDAGFRDGFMQRMTGMTRFMVDEISNKYYSASSPDGYLYNWNLLTGENKPQEAFIQRLQATQMLMSDPLQSLWYAVTRHVDNILPFLQTYSDGDPATLEALVNNPNTYKILRADDDADINTDVLKKAYSVLTDFSQGYIADERLLENGQKKLYNWQNYFFEEIATDSMYKLYGDDWQTFLKARNNKMEQHLLMLSSFISEGGKLPIDVTTRLAIGVMLQNDIQKWKNMTKGESAEDLKTKGAELVRLYLPYIKMGDPKLLTQMATTDFLIKNPQYISKDTKLDEQTGMVDTTKFLSLKEGADPIFGIFASNVIAGLEGKDNVNDYKSPLGNLMKISYDPKDTPEDKKRKLEAALNTFNYFWEYNDFVMPTAESRLASLNALVKQNYDFIKYANDNAERLGEQGKLALSNLNKSTFQVNEGIKSLASKAIAEHNSNGESGYKNSNNYNKNKPAYKQYQNWYNNNKQQFKKNYTNGYTPRQYQNYSDREQSYYNGRVRLSTIDNGRLLFDNKKPLGRTFSAKQKRAKLLKLNKTRRRSNTQSSRII